MSLTSSPRDRPRPAPPPARQRLPLAVTAVVLLVLAVRQQQFVAAHAVDVMYFDSWELYQPLFDGGGWWASFDLQHGPHRQGLGGLLMRATAVRSRWDTRCDAAAVSWVLIAAAVLGVGLAWRCGVRGWPLVAVPVLYLNRRQYAMFVASANPAHGAIPVLLITALGLAGFARPAAVRLPLVVGLTAGSIFTGFAVFVGLIVPPLLAVELVAAWRAGDRRRAAAVGAALVAVAATWAVFAHGYRFDPASAEFRFPVERPIEYLGFVGVMLANAVGVGSWQTGPGWGTVAIGLCVTAAVAAVCLDRGRRVVRAGARGDPASAALFCLSAYGLLFAADAAVGRTPMGWQTGAASRYVTLCVPPLMAVLCRAGASPRRAVRRLAVGCGFLMAVGTVTLHPGDEREAAAIRDACLHWRRAYLFTGDPAAADRLTHFLIYPDLYPRPLLPARLDYLRRNGLNLFDPAVWPDVPQPGRRATPPGTGGR